MGLVDTPLVRRRPGHRYYLELESLDGVVVLIPVTMSGSQVQPKVSPEVVERIQKALGLDAES
jgi:hypothetical protein